MNVSKCVDFEKLAESEKHIHFVKIEILLDCVEVEDYTNAKAKNKFEDLEWTM